MGHLWLIMGGVAMAWFNSLGVHDLDHAHSLKAM